MTRKTVALRLDPSIWHTFKKSADKTGRTRSNALERLMLKTIEADGFELEDPPPKVSD